MFSTSLSFYHPFITGVLHGGSTWAFFKDLIHSRSVLQNSCWRSSSIHLLHFEVQFLLPYLLRWCYVILDNLSSCFMIHMLSRMRYFKSINLFVGVILEKISPKAFPKECCYCGVYQWSKFSPILSAKEVFISSLLSSNHLFLVSGRLSPHNFELSSISPQQAYPFVVDNPTTPF